jgi:hypothetical protein
VTVRCALGQLTVGSRFIPEVAVREPTYGAPTRNSIQSCPESSRSIRKLSWIGGVIYVEDGSRVPRHGTRPTCDRVRECRPFRRGVSGRLRARSASIPDLVERYRSVGSYNTTRHPRPTSPAAEADHWNLRVDHGRFTAAPTALSATRGRLSFGPKLFVEPTYSVNWVDLEEGSFTTHLAGGRVTYTATSQMFASALLQYNSDNNTVATNVRLRWEYLPGSELFIVYNDERDTRARLRFATRSLIKINRLVRF